MTTREKRLAVAVAGTVAIWFGNRGLSDYREAVEQNLDTQLQASEALVDAEIELELAQRARRQLNQWRRASLPTNVNVARSLYQDWLRDQFESAGLTLKDLTDNSSGVGDEIIEVSFVASAAGSLESLTSFLARFYAANLLHRISGSSVSVQEGGDQLDIQLSVDALVLPECSRSDELPELQQDDLPEEFDSLLADVVRRNVFQSYRPPSKAPVVEVVRKDNGPDLDAKAAKVSGMTYGIGGWRVAVTTDQSAAPTYYHEGDPFEVGRMKGRVAKIDARRVILDTDQGDFEVRLGQSFAEAEPVGGRDI